jgi:hypothetical protein
MPIVKTEGGTMFTGQGVNVFRWASVKAQLKLEQLGMRSSGGPLRPRLAQELGLKPRDSHDKYIAAVQAKLDAAAYADAR